MTEYMASAVNELELHCQPSRQESIRVLVSALRNFFKAVASTAKVMQSAPIVYTAAKLQIGRLRMWTEGFESEGFSLKEILEADHELAGAVLRLITEFSVHVLTELGYICGDDDAIEELSAAILVSFPAGSSVDDDSSEGSLSSSMSSLDETAATMFAAELEYIVDSLYRYSTLVEERLDTLLEWKDRTQRLLQAFDGTFQVFLNLVSDQFPKADPDIVQLCATSLHQAYKSSNNLQQSHSPVIQPKHHAQSLADQISFNDSGLGPSTQSRPHTTHSVNPMPTPSSRDGLSMTSRIPKPVLAPGESVVSVSNISDESRLTFEVSGVVKDKERALLPRIPPSTLPHGGFLCTICGEEQPPMTKSAWKKHIFLDIVPYMCFNHLCSESGVYFPSYTEWVTHVGENDWYRHVGHHFERMKLIILPPSLRSSGSDNLGSGSNVSNAASVNTGHNLSVISEEKDLAMDSVLEASEGRFKRLLETKDCPDAYEKVDQWKDAPDKEQSKREESEIDRNFSATPMPTLTSLKWYRITDIPQGVTKEGLDAAIGSLYATSEGVNFTLKLYPSCDSGLQTALLQLEAAPEYFRNVKDDGPNSARVTLDYDENGTQKETTITLDSTFYNLTQLNDPQDTVEADVIAVTGLGGHAYSSWRNRKSNNMWLHDFLPNRFKNVRIMTYGYGAMVTSESKTQNALLSNKMHLIDAIEHVRLSEPERKRPIIFIGHGFGVLLIKQALIASKELVDATQCIMLFGAPHGGLETSDPEPMADTLGRRRSWGDLLKNVRTDAEGREVISNPKMSHELTTGTVHEAKDGMGVNNADMVPVNFSFGTESDPTYQNICRILDECLAKIKFDV